MSTVYAVVVKDRHTDLDIQIFEDEGCAVTMAQLIYYDAICNIASMPSDPWDDATERWNERQEPGVVPIKGWPFHAYYTSEGDSVSVRPVAFHLR